MLTPKLVIPLMLEETVRVKVALTEAPGLKTVPSRFQLKTMGPLAAWGTQFEVVMPSERGTLHSFLM